MTAEQYAALALLENMTEQESNEVWKELQSRRKDDGMTESERSYRYHG